MNYQPLGDRPNFFRSIISNQATTENDIDYMLKEFHRLGDDMWKICTLQNCFFWRGTAIYIDLVSVRPFHLAAEGI